MNDFNPSGAALGSSQLVSPFYAKNAFLKAGQSYWVTYPYIRLSYRNWNKTEHRVSATEKLICEAVNGDLGLFKTKEISYEWVNETSCVAITDEPPAKNDFWSNLFS
jgi:glucose-6-phosphate 1-dehydrogenase